jgi:hypothetical protein
MKGDNKYLTLKFEQKREADGYKKVEVEIDSHFFL